MSEKQKQTGSESTKKPENQTLTPEQEKQLQKEREQVILLSKMQRQALSNEAVENYLSKFHNINLSKYSPEIRQKFIEEIQMVFSEFKDFDKSMISKLRAIREGMSFGLETGKSDEYYRNMIIGNAIESKITVLKATIETQYGETIDFKGIKVNKTDFETYQTNIKNLDTKNGLSIFDAINTKLRPSITGGLNFNTLNIQQIFKDECKKSNQPYSETLFQEYNKYYQEFVGKNMVFQSKNGNGVIGYKGKGFGLQNGGPTGLDNDRLKDIYKYKMQDVNIENMGVADLVILLRVLFGIVPVAGDIDSAQFDLRQLDAGVNFDGSMQKTGEKVLSAASPVIGVLSIIGVGYGVKVAINSPKYKKAIGMIGKIVDKLSKSPEMLEDLAKNEKVMSILESIKGGIKGIDNLLVRIKKIKKVGEYTRRNRDVTKNGENITKINSYYYKLESTGIDISELKKGNYPEDELLATLENIITKLQNQEIKEKVSIILGLGLKISIFDLKYIFIIPTDKLKKIEILIQGGLSQCSEIKEIYFISKDYNINIFDIAIQFQQAGFKLSKLDLYRITELNLTDFEVNNIMRLKKTIKDFTLRDVLSDMKGTHGVTIDRSFENQILSMQAGFNPEIALKDIKKLPKDVRKIALEKFKELYEEQIKTILSIKDNMNYYIQNHSLKDLKNQEDINNYYKNLLSTLEIDLLKLSIEQRQKTMESIYGYITKIINTDLFFPLGTRNPKKILSQHLGFSEEIITGNVINAKFEGFPVFFVSPDDYNKFLTMGKEITPATSGVGHIDKYKSDYVILDGGYIVISGDPTKIDLYSVLKHEVRHGLNTFLMPDLRDNILNTALARGKDEIIAYLSGGSNLSDVFRELISSDAYDYFKRIKKSSPDEYNRLREEYTSLLGKNFEYATQLIQQGIGLDELSITPFTKWYKIKPKQGVEKVFEIYQNGDIRKKIEYENGVVQVGIFGKDGVMKGGVKKYLGYEENGDFDINGKLLKGMRSTPDGTFLDGEFHNGNIIKGIFKKPNGIYLEGEFVNGEIVIGKQIFNGITSEGIFQKGILVDGRVTLENGDYFEGIFNDGKIFDGVGSISGHSVKIIQGNITKKS